MIREGNAGQMGWRGKTGQMDRRNVDKVRKRNRLHLNFTTTIKFDYSLGVLWAPTFFIKRHFHCPTCEHTGQKL